VGVGVAFRPGEPKGVGVGVAVAVGVGVGVGVGLGLISVGPFGVAVGVGLGVGLNSGVGETVGVGEELCPKARRRGAKPPATIRSNKQTTAAAAGISTALARRNRTTQSDAGCHRAVGHLDLRRFSSNVTIEP